MARTVAQERWWEVEEVEAPEEARRAAVGEEKTFRRYDPDQVLLMAPVLAEWIPEADLAHFVSDLVESGTLDLSAIYDSYEAGERRSSSRCSARSAPSKTAAGY